MPEPPDRAELEARLDNVTERLLGAFEELDFLHSLSEVLSQPSAVEDLDAYLVEQTRGILGADGGWVVRTAEDGLRVTARDAVAQGVVDVLTASLLPRLIAGERLPYLVDDLHRELARDRSGGPLPEDMPRAFLAAGLAVQGDLLGVVCLAKNAPGDTFTARDRKLITTLTTQAAFFVRNADLLRGFKSQATRLGRRLEKLEADNRNFPDISLLKGRSPAMRHLARQVEGSAATDATVLLLGESGSGKSLVARILHRLSGRRAGPFVEINCGAVPPALIESELFGHARGAFTGADRDRSGLFEEAESGSILLDEVAELPMEAQVKLLTVLEQRRVRRVGENRDRPVNARVIAATNADLTAAVKAGAFREDLFYRLNVITLTVPPLRERREEILPLARKFLTELSRETHRRVEGFTGEAEEALVRYDWPGNVRELRNVVERSLLLVTEGQEVGADAIPLRAAGAAHPGGPEWTGEPLTEAVRGYERRLLVEALERAGGVVSRAAASLGITRTNLHNKLRKHGLSRTSTWNDERH